VSRLVLTIRPEPGCSATVRIGRMAGLDIEGCPLFEVRPCEWAAPAAGGIDGLLIGSANALRHAGPQLEAFRDKPVYAVGAATARAAEAAGFTVGATGRGGLQRLLDTLPPPLVLLRLAGEERVPLTPSLGIVMKTVTVYQSVPQPMPGVFAARLTEGALVLLHSAAAARHFAAECDRYGVSRDMVSLAALGPRIAAAAGEGWRMLRLAVEPREAALLALARDMCHDLPLT
jgi:uroporphyrinogen-III synthase